ncbi:MAG TPA: thioredoxin family protein [Candidatus Binatia bacterium]|nr:thioredoxin family protein [Candidatus Binatia bacterium]
MNIEMGSSGRRLSALLAAAVVASAGLFAADTAPRRWKEDELVKSYGELVSSGGLEAAIRTPALPKDPPQAAFLDALAWYAAGAPGKAGHLTRKQLDEQINLGVDSYQVLLKAKAERGEENDYARTRTWKLIQKYTLLREEMSKPSRKGRYAYPALRKEAGGAEVDAWDREHTLKSPDEFVAKVCRASFERPVLVKYGNTNCTQCMLFEIIGSVKEIADNPAHKGAIDVYKVWFGFRPDEGFAGRIRDPERLEALAKAEGVSSSPTFIVYRNGRRYTCGDAFPDENGMDERLESCLKQDFGEAPMASACETAAS